MGFLDCLRNKFKCIEELRKYRRHQLVYAKLPVMKDVGVRAEVSDLQRQWSSQFNRELFQSSKGEGVTRWNKCGYGNYRIPMNIMEAILEASPVDIFHYDTNYRCNDFALSLFSEINLGAYWEMFFGIVTISGHRINCFWPSDRNNIYYIEPQDDKIFLPDMDKDWAPLELWM